MTPTTRRLVPLALLAALAASLGSATADGQEGAPEDAAKEVRLLVLEGKYADAEALLASAPQAVRNDAALHLWIAQQALQKAKAATADAKRAHLTAARDHFRRVLEIDPKQVAAAAGALAAARELADLHVASKDPEGARKQLGPAIEAGEAGVKAGAATADVKIALARALAMRASLVQSVEQVDALVADSRRAAELLADAATGRDDGPALLGEAAAIRLSEARFVHDRVPIAEEKRDEQAALASLELATKACASKDASETQTTVHLHTLLLLHRWKVPEAAGTQPFTKTLGPPVEGLTLLVPRAAGWSRATAKDWDLQLDRTYDADDGSVQILLKAFDANAQTMGRSWGQLEDVALRRHEKYHEDFGEITYEVKPTQLTDGKKRPEVWHYAVGGKLKAGRRQRLGEWIWHANKKERVWQLKILDWRRAEQDLEEPDLVAFVSSAIGEGVWPVPEKGKTPPKKGGGKKK